MVVQEINEAFLSKWLNAKEANSNLTVNAIVAELNKISNLPSVTDAAQIIFDKKFTQETCP
jgi:hypothetical protein